MKQEGLKNDRVVSPPRERGLRRFIGRRADTRGARVSGARSARDENLTQEFEGVSKEEASRHRESDPELVSAVPDDHSMRSVVAVSFCCVIIGGALVLEWGNISDAGFVIAALAAVVLFSAIDAW